MLPYDVREFIKEMRKLNLNIFLATQIPKRFNPKSVIMMSSNRGIIRQKEKKKGIIIWEFINSEISSLSKESAHTHTHTSAHTHTPTHCRESTRDRERKRERTIAVEG